MTWNPVVFFCSGMGGRSASIAGGPDSGKPARSYLPEGVTTAIMKEPGFGRGRAGGKATTFCQGTLTPTR
jgi:hypothetical protein